MAQASRIGYVSRPGRRSRAAAFTTEANQRESNGKPIRCWRSCSCPSIHDLDSHVLEAADVARGHLHAASRRDGRNLAVPRCPQDAWRNGAPQQCSRTRGRDPRRTGAHGLRRRRPASPRSSWIWGSAIKPPPLIGRGHPGELLVDHVAGLAGLCHAVECPLAQSHFKSDLLSECGWPSCTGPARRTAGPRDPSSLRRSGIVPACRRLRASLGSGGWSRGTRRHHPGMVAGTAPDVPICQVPIPLDRSVAVGLDGGEQIAIGCSCRSAPVDVLRKLPPSMLAHTCLDPRHWNRPGPAGCADLATASTSSLLSTFRPAGRSHCRTTPLDWASGTGWPRRTGCSGNAELRSTGSRSAIDGPPSPWWSVVDDSGGYSYSGPLHLDSGSSGRWCIAEADGAGALCPATFA